ADRRGPRRAGRGRPRRPAGQRGHLDGGLGDGGRAGAPARPSPTTTLNRDPPGHPLPGPPRPPVRGPSSTGTASTTPTRRWHGGPGAPRLVTSVTPNGGVRVVFLGARWAASALRPSRRARGAASCGAPPRAPRTAPPWATAAGGRA